jgi:hypothetical protein
MFIGILKGRYVIGIGLSIWYCLPFFGGYATAVAVFTGVAVSVAISPFFVCIFV